MFENVSLEKNLLDLKAFHPFPKYEERAAWDNLSQKARAYMMHNGEAYLHYDWPLMPASVYMEFVRTGNRSHSEEIIFNRRRYPLICLVLAECCEGKGRFIDDIINGVWTTLDESSWLIPACNQHTLPRGREARPLPDTLRPDGLFTDLFAAECGAMLAWIYNLMGDRLDAEAPQVTPRLLHEVDRRVLAPFLENQFYQWMGYHGDPVNNWNPWICSNLLLIAGVACPCAERRKAVIRKCMECLEYFLKGYAPDGGCDEGPSYWAAAGAALFDCLSILDELTAHRGKLCSGEWIANICTYIYKMHIDKKYYVNFADCMAKLDTNPAMVYRMGKVLGRPDLCRFARALFVQMEHKEDCMKPSGGSCHLYRQMGLLEGYEALLSEEPCPFPYVQDVWFPGIQVMAARMQPGSCDGLYLAAKGGHNNESHNHNDVGSFVIYCDGKPAFIDVGTGQYTRQTFSPQRYEIPQINSLYHNVPFVNGAQQIAGRSFSSSGEQRRMGRRFNAEDVSYENTGSEVRFSLDLRAVYDEAAGITGWKRSFLFDREHKEIVLEDDFKLNRSGKAAFAFMTAVRPALSDGVMTLVLDDETTCTMQYDPSLVAETEVFVTENDALLCKSWGKQVYRTRLWLPQEVKNGKTRFVFRKK